MLLESITLAQILQNNQTQNISPLPSPIPIVEKHKPEKTKPLLYTVKRGDTLTKISKKKHVPVKRLWAYNKQLKHQDKLDVGDTLKVPRRGVKLKPRAFIKPRVVQVTPKQQTALTAPARVSGGPNTYTWGNCTWYVKNRKPSVPNGWHNAFEWDNYARITPGWTVSSTPVVGAVAQTDRGPGHVAYVEKVSGGQVYISEMNVKGLGVQSYAWRSISDFVYIY